MKRKEITGMTNAGLKFLILFIFVMAQHLDVMPV